MGILEYLLTTPGQVLENLVAAFDKGRNDNLIRGFYDARDYLLYHLHYNLFPDSELVQAMGARRKIDSDKIPRNPYPPFPNEHLAQSYMNGSLQAFLGLCDRSPPFHLNEIPMILGNNFHMYLLPPSAVNLLNRGYGDVVGKDYQNRIQSLLETEVGSLEDGKARLLNFDGKKGGLAVYGPWISMYTLGMADRILDGVGGKFPMKRVSSGNPPDVYNLLAENLFGISGFRNFEYVKARLEGRL